MCSRIYGVVTDILVFMDISVVTDIRCNGYMMKSQIYCVFRDIRCFHEYTLWSRIYGVVTVIVCVHDYHVCSRIYVMFMDIR